MTLKVRHQERGFTVTRRNLLIALLSSTALVGTALPQKAAYPKQPSKDSRAEENVKELLPLMDTDKSGKISKQEWMKFMEAEFDRLDKDKKGELDRNELLQSGGVRQARSYCRLGQVTVAKSPFHSLTRTGSDKAQFYSMVCLRQSLLPADRAGAVKFF